MPRVTNQKTRQALLVTGDPLDASELPEKIELFNEDGEPLMIGGSYTRDVKVHTTASLLSGGSESAVLTMFPGWRLFRMVTNRPARVRVYPSAAQRDADLARSVGTKPSGNHGRLLEVVTIPGVLDLTMTPAVDFSSVALETGDFYISVSNRDSVTASVVVTFYYVRTE